MYFWTDRCQEGPKNRVVCWVAGPVRLPPCLRLMEGHCVVSLLSPGLPFLLASWLTPGSLLWTSLPSPGLGYHLTSGGAEASAVHLGGPAEILLSPQAPLACLLPDTYLPPCPSRPVLGLFLQAWSLARSLPLAILSLGVSAVHWALSLRVEARAAGCWAITLCWI